MEAEWETDRGSCLNDADTWSDAKGWALVDAKGWALVDAKGWALVDIKGQCGS